METVALVIIWPLAFLCVLQFRLGKRICISAVEGARNGSSLCVGMGHGLMGYEFRAAKDGWNLFLRKSGELRGNRASCPCWEDPGPPKGAQPHVPAEDILL